MKAEVTDLRAGIYRRQYAGFIKGKRINALSLSAEAWFWRFNVAADDFGNADAEPHLMYSATIGRRSDVTQADVTGFYREAVDQHLLREYVVNGEHFYHVADFETKQPAGKNGKRVRRYPASPWDAGIIPVNPDSTSASHSHSHSHSDSDSHSENDSCAETPASSARQAVDPAAVSFPEFPTCGEVKTWRLEDAHIAELQATFPGVDVKAEARKAFGWVKADLKRRKTARGMGKFLYGWMDRTQNRGPKNSGGRRSEIDAAVEAM